MNPAAKGPPLSNDLLLAVLRQTSEIVLILDPEGRIARAFGLDRMGYSDAELVGRDAFVTVLEEDRARVREGFARRVSGVESEPIEIRGLHADGSVRWYEVSTARFEDEDGGIWIVSVARDIHQRVRDQTSLSESEARYRSLVESSPLGILIIDRELNLVSANEAYARQVGAPSLEALKGHNIMASPALDAEAVGAIAERVRAGETISTSLSYVSLFGKQVDVRVNIAPAHDEAGNFVAAQLVFEDVSESRRLEEQLRQSQKMEAVGRLAGGIAHDFNNNLTVILGQAEQLSKARSASDTREAAGDIVQAAERSVALTRQLLTFSRRGEAALEPTDVRDVVARLEPMLERVLGEQIDLSCTVAEDLPRIEAEPQLLEQAIINLVVNARDAMPEGGELRIASYLDAHGQVVLEVVDDGIGMDDDTRAQSFEPFFTTKYAGQGTGLGLAVVYGIVRQFHGTVEVESAPSEGACFRMCFRALDAEVAAQAKREPPEEPRSVDGDERILVLEDQPPVRAFLAKALRSRGYEVVEAETGNQALALAREAAPGIDLLLSDVRVPGLSGPQTVSLLQEERPGLRVLYISGYNDLPRGAEGTMADGFELLAKPFSVSHLLRRVRATLDQPAP